MEHEKLDLEKLDKSQLVLLTLFVSFMTSIATGIVTVSLMEQAPPTITETVNRVVERTVERVVPGQVASAAQPIVRTVVVKESELISKAVESVAPSVVRVYSGSDGSSEFLGLGIVLDSTGGIAVDSAALTDLKGLVVELSGSMRVAATVSGTNQSSGVTFLAAATSTKDGPIPWHAAQLGSARPVLGQTVVLISGRSSARVAQGLVTALVPFEGAENGSLPIIETDINKDVIISGSPIISTDGVVLGISTKLSRTTMESGFMPASLIQETQNEKSAETQ